LLAEKSYQRLAVWIILPAQLALMLVELLALLLQLLDARRQLVALTLDGRARLRVGWENRREYLAAAAWWTVSARKDLESFIVCHQPCWIVSQEALRKSDCERMGWPS